LRYGFTARKFQASITGQKKIFGNSRPGSQAAGRGAVGREEGGPGGRAVTRCKSWCGAAQDNVSFGKTLCFDAGCWMLG